MDAKLLTEKGWKDTAAKFKIKDNGLQKALAVYEKLAEDHYDERLKGITSLIQLGAALKKDKAAAASPDVVKYLTGMVAGAIAEQAEITKAKVIAEKAKALLAAKAAEKHDCDEKKGGGKEDEKQEKEEEEEGDYATRLLAGIQKVKGAKDVAFEFLVCDAKPHCGLMVARKITPKHREELSKVTGGSKHFLPLGTCQFVDGRFNFNMDAPPSGLARKLQDSIKSFTGKKFPIKVGAESVGDDDDKTAAGQPAAGAAAGTGAAKPESPALAKAPELWHQAEERIAGKLAELKQAVKKEFAGHDAAVTAEIEKNMKRFDGIFEALDHKLSDSLAKAHAATDAAARAAELKNAKAILGGYINYMKTEQQLIAHIDANPFGVKVNLKQDLAETMTRMAQAIGAPA